MNLREFSELLGLSPTTVSRALGGYPEVKEATRRKVAEAARKHGYRPNRRAASLATGRAMSIGHVIPTSLNHEMVNPVFADFIAGAGEVYARSGYDLVLSVVADGADEERVYRQMAATGSVDGVIIHGPRVNDPRIDLMRETGLPFVVHGRTSDEAHDYSYVDMDNRRGFQRATDYLLDLGHRRIALLNGHANMDFARRRHAGYAAALAAKGISEDPELLFHGEMSETNAHDAARGMLRLPDRPTAFLTSSLIMAIGVRRAVHDAGLVLGEDVSLVTHDDELSYLGNEGERPIFTANRSGVRGAGARCAEILLDQIANPGQPPVQELRESEFLPGRSSGPLRAPAAR